MKQRQGYNIVVVPNQSSAIRRFQCSRRTVWYLATLACFSLLLFLGSLGAAWTYWTAYQKMEVLRGETARFQRERGLLASKIQELDTSVSRAYRLAAELKEKSVSEAKNRSGKGPLVNENNVSTGLLWRKPLDLNSRKELKDLLSELERDVHMVETNLHETFLFREDRLYLWSSLPAIWPTRGWISSDFGDRRRLHGTHRWHQGIDIASPRGAPILASGDGEVIYAGYKSGYGKIIIVDHGYGITSVYGHCSEIFVKEGKQLKRGETIGRVGNTGRSTGPHLHYEIRLDGVAVNPVPYILEQS